MFRISLLVLLSLLMFGCYRSTAPSASKPSSPAESPDKPLVISAAQSPTDGDCREPELYSTADGRIILNWVEKVGAKRYALRTALRDTAGWSETQTVAEGENWFINWADFPSVIALPDGLLAAHWLVKSGAGTYAYDVNIALSKDGGKTWDKPVVPHLDKTHTEHGFVSLIPLTDGRVGAVWLDGRNLKDLNHNDEHSAQTESMTLRFAAIDGKGKLSDEFLLDERVCECCQTSAAMTSEGPIVAYRDRSDTEVRDIFVVRSKNGVWGAPGPVHADNWQINGCPVNGPSIVANGSHVAIAWFTEAGDAPRVKVAFSDDSGATFARPIEVDDGAAIGRVDALLLADGSVLVCWMAGTVESGAIKVRRIQADGTLGQPAEIAKTDISRSSGFPRMARLGNEVYFAWTEFGKPSRLRLATAEVGL